MDLPVLYPEKYRQARNLERKKTKKMNKKNNNKGFTLAELLIVVAIIGVLVAIAMPTFSKQLEAAREAADIANIRSAYAEAVTTYLTDGAGEAKDITIENIIISQTTAGWESGTVTGAKDTLPFTMDLTSIKPTKGTQPKKDITFSFTANGEASVKEIKDHA